MEDAELCQWLRDNSSGVYRPAAEAADRIEELLKNQKPKKVAKRFVKPAHIEAATYFHELGSATCNDDATDFCDHFESNGWKVGGKAPMKCWKASIRKWKKNKDKGMFAAPEKTGMLGTDISDTGFVRTPPPADDNMAFLEQTRARALEHRQGEL